MPLNVSGRLLLSGVLLAGCGVVLAQVPAGAAVVPTAPLPTATTPDGWSAVRLPVAAGTAGSARLAVAGSGQMLADWGIAASSTGSTLRSAVAVVRPNGGVAGAPSLGRTATVPFSLAAAPTVDHAGRGILLGTRNVYTQRTGLGWATVSATGKVSKLKALTTPDLADGQSVALAENARGDAVAAWIEDASSEATVKAALRPAGKSFGRPITLFAHADEEASGVAAAVDPSGRVAVAFGARLAGSKAVDRRLFLETGTSKATALSKPIVAGPQDSNAQISASYAKGGRLDLLWGSQTGGEEAGSPWVIRATSLGKNAHAIEDVQTLDDGVKAPPHGPLQVVPGPGSSSIAAWTATASHDRHPVRVATSNPFGQYGDPQTIAADGALGGLAASSDGAAVVTVEPADAEGATGGDDLRVSTSVRASGGSFPALAPLGAAALDPAWYTQPLGVAIPAPVIAPATGGAPRRAIVAWLEAPKGGAASLVLSQRPL